MKHFEGAGAERGFDLSHLGRLDPDAECGELEALCSRLSKARIAHEHWQEGLWRGLEFDSPHGEVRVRYGPGTLGYPRLLEAECQGWDLSPRGGLTALDVFLTYLTGGW